MQAGGERLLIVPAKLGYGNRKIDGIPAGSTLRFGELSTIMEASSPLTKTCYAEVKLLEIK